MLHPILPSYDAPLDGCKAAHSSIRLEDTHAVSGFDFAIQKSGIHNF